MLRSFNPFNIISSSFGIEQISELFKNNDILKSNRSVATEQVGGTQIRIERSDHDDKLTLSDLARIFPNVVLVDQIVMFIPKHAKRTLSKRQVIDIFVCVLLIILILSYFYF